MSVRTAHSHLTRTQLERAAYPSYLVSNAVAELVEQILPGEFDASTLAVSGRWDALTDTFLLNARVWSSRD